MGGGRRCMVVNCKSKRTDKKNKVSFHEVPVDPKRRKLWYKMLQPYIDPLDQKEITHVCGKHFEKKCFMAASKRNFLVRDAVPTIFNFDNSDEPVDPTDKDGKLTKQNGIKRKQKKEDGRVEEGGGEVEENTSISSTNDAEMTPQAMKVEESEATKTSKYLIESVKIYHENGRADVCRICFREAYRHKKLTDRHCTRIQTYKEMMEYLSFGINFDFYPDPVICLNCIMMLLSAYDFKKKCLKTENTLEKYHSSRVSLEKPMNILIIANRKRNESIADEITIEITDSPSSRNGDSQSLENVEIVDHDFEIVDHDYSRTSEPNEHTPERAEPIWRTPERREPSSDRPAQRRRPNGRSAPRRDELREPTPPDLKPTKRPEIRGDPPYLCHECGRFFLNWRQCRRHLRNHRLNRKTVESFTCEVCKTTFKNVNVAEHMDTHRRKRYKCVHCDRQFDRSNLLATHMQANHERSPYVTCDVCGKVCRRKFLTTHMAKHFDEKDAECPVCGQMFYRWYLQKHIKTHSAKKVAPGSKEKCVCHVCGRSVTEGQLKAHLQSHVDVPKFKCEVCEINFKTKCELQIHSTRKIHLRNVMLDVVANTSTEKD